MTRPEQSGFVHSDFPLPLSMAGYDAHGQLLWASDRVSCGLAVLEDSLLRQYFRLERVERNLSAGNAARAIAQARGRRDAGIRAQKQLELERQRLGRELHTGVGQMLAAMRLQLDVIAEQLPNPPEVVSKALDRLSVLAREAVEQVRALSRKLHPPEWLRLTVGDAIRQLWELTGVPQAFEATLRIEELPQEPDLPIKMLIYRLLQEALSNLMRHARATRVDAVLESRDGWLKFTLTDNGVGFDVAALENAPANVASGIGLRSMREQAAALGAVLKFESGTGGTKVTVLAPFAAQD